MACEPRIATAELEWHIFSFGSPAADRSYALCDHAQGGVKQRTCQCRRESRWHDNRHTLITESAQSGAVDQTLMDIASHFTQEMLKHYSHIQMEAKRDALETVVQNRATAASKQNGSQQ
jgi:hypothetical protein